VIVYYTVRVGELVFRDFDPYYVLFTGGTGHGIVRFGLWVTLGVLLLGSCWPLGFCRFLCRSVRAWPRSDGSARCGSRARRRLHGCGMCDSACAWESRSPGPDGDQRGMQQLPGLRAELSGARQPAARRGRVGP